MNDLEVRVKLQGIIFREAKLHAQLNETGSLINYIQKEFQMFDELKTRIRKNIERNEAALADLRKQLAQVEQLERAQAELPLTIDTSKAKATTK